MRLIDADKLKQHYAWWNNEEQRVFDQIVDAQPTADAVPVVHGEWVVRPTSGRFPTYECSVCHGYTGGQAFVKTCVFCPNCGAKMDGGAK
jgi:PHP family Zn ribbon phosphoesterase